MFSSAPCTSSLPQTVGRGAASLLDPQFSRGPGSGSGSKQGMQRTPSDWAATFDSCFELYGGAQAAEELDQLSSECAHICNRWAVADIAGLSAVSVTVCRVEVALGTRCITAATAAGLHSMPLRAELFVVRGTVARLVVLSQLSHATHSLSPVAAVDAAAAAAAAVNATAPPLSSQGACKVTAGST
jgi:hypothetical protein